jgi:sugar/nucleoside kinase (ribokinase family)
MKKIFFDYIAGTGGIGTGRLFELEGNHTLGRSESRPALLTGYMDYCKLHIILHYAAVFLGGDVPIYAIGRVGADGEGRAIRAEMAKAGINIIYVTEDAHNPTMYSLCCQYPNGESFNITTQNSACQTVGVADVDRFFDEVNPKGRGFVLAAPEVPLDTRLHLLRKGRQRKCFNVAAVLSSEALYFSEQGGVTLTDLISLNIDEAMMFASLWKEDGNDKWEIISHCINYLKSINSNITIIITLGAEGAIVWQKDHFYESRAIDTQVVNTAGAGDCFLGTVMAAMIRGVDLFPFGENRNMLNCAIDLGIVASNKKIECKDTIDFSMTVESLESFAWQHGIFFSDNIRWIFFDHAKKQK